MTKTLEGAVPSAPGGGAGFERGADHAASSQAPETHLHPVSRPSPAVAITLGLLGAAAVTALYLFGSHGFALSEPDEARYAEIAREMLVRHDWTTPHLNFVKYLEKPPLVYWGTALSFAMFGIGELAARLPSVLAGLATLALCVWFAARTYGTATALLTLPILGLGPLFGFLAQILTLDMSLTFFMTAAMVAVWFGWSSAMATSGAEPPSARGWYRIAYVATALAVLVKGPVAAVLVGGAALLFLTLHGGWRAVRPALDWRGAALALLVLLPWHVLVSWRNPEFVHFYVVEQHLARYLWTREHGEPIWFFLPAIPVALGAWGLMLLFDPPLLRAALAPRSWTPATRFLVIWAAVIVVFFSLSTSKLVTYVLPAIPPLAILTARTIVLGCANGRTAGLSRLAWLLLIAGPLMGLCGVLLPLVHHHWRAPLVVPHLLAGGALLLATGWLIRRELGHGRVYAALGVLAVGWYAMMAVAVTTRAVANEYRALGLSARAAMQPDDRLAMYNHVTQGIPFYAQRRVIMVRNIGELKFGSEQGDQSGWFWRNDDDLRREWAAPGRLFLVINRSELHEISPPLDPRPTVVAVKGKKVLVVNR